MSISVRIVAYNAEIAFLFSASLLNFDLIQAVPHLRLLRGHRRSQL